MGATALALLRTYRRTALLLGASAAVAMWSILPARWLAGGLLPAPLAVPDPGLSWSSPMTPLEALRQQAVDGLAAMLLVMAWAVVAVAVLTLLALGAARTAQRERDAVGDRVLVEGERSIRVATVAVASTRRALRDRLGRRVLRKADPAPEAGHGDGGLLRLAKDRAAALRLPIKLFRVEYATPPGAGGRGGKANLYFTSDERVELRELLRDLGQASGARIELRQVGARDEAKQVGGIGSCGQELCCSTWLPEFVPVSIKMAKDQGMVLSPTKVSGSAAASSAAWSTSRPPTPSCARACPSSASAW